MVSRTKRVYRPKVHLWYFGGGVYGEYRYTQHQHSTVDQLVPTQVYCIPFRRVMGNG